MLDYRMEGILSGPADNGVFAPRSALQMIDGVNMTSSDIMLEIAWGTLPAGCDLLKTDER